MLAETRNDEAFALSFVSQSLAKLSSIFDGLYQSEMSFSTYELSHKTISSSNSIKSASSGEFVRTFTIL